MTKKKQSKKKQKSKRELEMERFSSACDEAKKTRDSNRPLRDEYRNDASKQAQMRKRLITDLLHVYNHPDNPYKGFAASRQRYRELGHFPEVFVVDFFGNHQEFLRAAELHDSRVTTTVRNKAALLHSHQQIAQYAERSVLPHVGMYVKHPTIVRNKRATVDVLIGSDLHGYFLDPFAFEVFLDVAEMVIEPRGREGIIVLNGDVADFPQISRHRKMPGHFHLNLHQEREAIRDNILRRVREKCPQATIYMVIGNHEYRLVTYLADCAPELAALPEMEFGTFFGLDEFEISLVCRSNFLAPTAKAKKADVRQNWLTLFDCYTLTHGTSCAANPAAVELNAYFRMSGTSGHVHRPQIVSANSLGTGPLSWMSTPMMAGFAVGKDYAHTPSAWQMGFGLATINPADRTVSQQIIWVHENWATFGGRDWRPTKAAYELRKQQMSV